MRMSMRTLSPARSWTSNSWSASSATRSSSARPTIEGAVAVVEHLLERDDLAGGLAASDHHDVVRLVEHDLLAPR